MSETGGVIFSRYRAYIFTTEYAPGWKDMKRRPHKVISVLLLAALIAGMGMACRERSLEIRNKRWEENAETVTQNSGRIFGDEPENLYARSAVLIDADSGRVLFEKEADGKHNKDYDVYHRAGVSERTSGSDGRGIGSGCVTAEGASGNAERRSILSKRSAVFSDVGIAQ